MKRGSGLVLAVLLTGCAHPSPAGQSLPPGQWGNEQAILGVSSYGGGKIVLGCAEATFAGPVKLDVGGHFLTSGTYVRGTGVATLNRPAGVPANISGRLDRGGVLWLDIATRDAYPLRNARLERGVSGKILRCL